MDDTADRIIPRLLDEHGGLIFNLGLRICKNREQAEDLVQETFLRAYRKWGQFDGRSKPATWLYAIAVRVCRRLHRRRSGEPSHFYSLEELLPNEEEGIVDLPANADEPIDDVLRQESRDLVDEAIAELPMHFRLALVLKDIAEFSVAEVAQVLGIKTATVKTRVHRARLLLRKELERHLPKRSAPPPGHPRHICLSLLQAKQEALDNGAPFPISEAEFCERCHSLLATLDLAREACYDLHRGELPANLRDILLKEFESGASQSG